MNEIDVGVAQKWVPRVFAATSFVTNPLLIYLILKKTRYNMGNYKYLLIAFSIFDICYSAVDMFTGMGILHYGKSMAIFVSHGPPYGNPTLSNVLLNLRCTLICTSYGFFTVHFFYRYLAVCRPHLLYIFERRSWIGVFIAFIVVQSVIFSAAAYIVIANNDSRLFMRPFFLNNYGVDVIDHGFIAIHFDEDHWTVRMCAYVATATASFLCGSQIISYVTFGVLIHRRLKSASASLSETSKRMHSQLLGALILQVRQMLSAFPAFDPVAIIIFCGDYRRSVLGALGFHEKSRPKKLSSGNFSRTVT